MKQKMVENNRNPGCPLPPSLGFLQLGASDESGQADRSRGPSVYPLLRFYLLLLLHAGDVRVAMRQGDVVYYLLTDHLGSTAITANSSGTPVGELRYRAYGETRYTSGTTPTSYRYTGQREESSLGLYRMGARWYDPALSRWLSPDTLVPEPGEPQNLNRYSYVLGNPLVFIDPSGHDLVIVGGYNNNNWMDPLEWKEWIMTYKGWTEAEWNDFYKAWRGADDAAKQQLMAANSVYFFDWTTCECVGNFTILDDDPHQKASRQAFVSEMLEKLEAQLAGLHDVTLIGHSKGGNLVLNYMQHNGSSVKNAVIVDALWEGSVMGVVGAMSPVLDETGHPFFADTPANIVNIYNVRDWVNSHERGFYNGDVVNLQVDQSEKPHSTKGEFASYVLYLQLNVALDHGARGWWGRGR